MSINKTDVILWLDHIGLNYLEASPVPAVHNSAYMNLPLLRPWSFPTVQCWTWRQWGVVSVHPEKNQHVHVSHSHAWPVQVYHVWSSMSSSFSPSRCWQLGGPWSYELSSSASISLGLQKTSWKELHTTLLYPPPASWHHQWAVT